MSVLKRSEYDMIFYFNVELHAGRLVEESSKKAKERAKTVVVGDMEPLLSALPTINIPNLATSTKSSNIG